MVEDKLIKSVYSLFQNTYTHRLSYQKFTEIIELGKQVSSIQLKIKYQHGSLIEKLRPKLLEAF